MENEKEIKLIHILWVYFFFLDLAAWSAALPHPLSSESLLAGRLLLCEEKLK